MLSHIYEILDVPRRAQQVVSHENTPTVSIALPAYALLLDAWKELRRELPELSHYINLGIMKIEEPEPCSSLTAQSGTFLDRTTITSMKTTLKVEVVKQ